MLTTRTFAMLGASLIGSAAIAGGPVDFYLTVLHNNDGESQLIDAGGSQSLYGGVARFATVVANLRTQAQTFPTGAWDNGSILISSGDNYLAGPEFNASQTNGVPYYDTIAMDLIGYDVATLGNHEFDFGPDVLRDFLLGFSGPSPVFLSANLDYTNEADLLALEGSGRLAKSHVVNVNGRDVGVIGATTPLLPSISSPRDVIVGQNILAAVQAEADALDLAGVKIIILSSHLQSVLEELDLAEQLTKVDAIISGGGDEILANPSDLLVPGDTASTVDGGGYPLTRLDLNGASVPVVTTAGNYKYVGRLMLGFDVDGNLVEVHSDSGPVRVSGNIADADFVTADATVQAQVVDPVEAAVAALAANIVAASDVALDGVRAHVRTQETNLGNLIADSYLYTASVRAVVFGTPLPDVALTNGGGIRNDSVLPAGDLSELDTFNVLPFTNFLCVIEDIQPAHFKEILENAVSRVEFTDGRFAQVAGFKYEYDPTGTAQVVDNDGNVLTPGSRVRNVILNDGREIVRDGVVLATAQPINIASIDFLARGGDQYPYRGAAFTILGLTYQQALEEYIVSFLGGTVNAQEYVEGGEQRIVALGGGQPSVGDEIGQILRLIGKPNRRYDLNHDGVVNVDDLVEVLQP